MHRSAETPEEVAEEETTRKARKRPGVIVVALSAAAACGIAGAASYLVAPFAMNALAPAGAQRNLQSDAPVTSTDAAETKLQVTNSGHAGKSKAAKQKGAEKATGDDGGENAGFRVTGGDGVFVMRPIVVTLKPQGRIRYLKVGLAVETTPESEAIFVDRELRIIDVVMSYLRAVPVSAIEDPIAMARIREQIGRRVSFIVDPAPVNAVLITDFILS